MIQGDALYCGLVSDFLKASRETKPRSIEKFSPKEIEFIRNMVMDELQELDESQDLCDQVDALVDLIYYVCHASMKKGIDLDPFFQIVHQANMQKCVGGVIRREDGKILKPASWKDPKPKLQQELCRQQEQHSS